MRRLIIDRFEGKFAVCEDSEQRYFAIQRDELPDGAAEGTVLKISEEGELSIDQQETDLRRSGNAKRQKKVFGGK